MAQNDQALLTRLRDSGLEFVVIGGVKNYFSIDIINRKSEIENFSCLFLLNPIRRY
jgi:hypothetical protein